MVLHLEKGEEASALEEELGYGVTERGYGARVW